MTVDATSAPASAPWRNGPRLLTAALLAAAAGPAVVAVLFLARQLAEGTDRAAMTTGLYDPKEWFPGPAVLVWGALVLLYVLAPFATPFLLVASVVTLLAGRARMSRNTWYVLLLATIVAPAVIAAVLVDGDIGLWLAD